MIVAISGRMNSGKDTVAFILQILDKIRRNEGKYFLKKKSNNDIERLLSYTDYNKYYYQDLQRWKIKKFADKLKDIVCLLINCSREQLEDEEFKSKKLGKEWNYYQYVLKEHEYFGKRLKTKREVLNYFKIKSEDYLKEFEEVRKFSITPRQILQLLGTECGREIIHPNIWVNALFSSYDDLKIDNWIITDLRFFNELKAIKERNGITIRINRKPEDEICHPSEVELDDYQDWDYVIENDGSISDLITKVRDINDKLIENETK